MAANLGKLLAMRTGAVWMLRVLWFVLPLSVGRAAGDAIATADHAVAQVMTTGLWVLWAIGLVATAIPLPLTLTAVRLISPGLPIVAMWALVTTDYAGISIVAAAHSTVATAAALSHLVGDRFVDGASYGDERRMLLRPSAPVVLVVAPLLWTLMAAATAAGPLLLAARQWILGGLLTVVAAGLCGLGARALHQLNRRWIVFVPTGMVLHDLSVLTEPVLFRRTAIERLGPAIEGSPARDLSNRAPGLLLECELTDAAPLGLRDPSNGPGAAGARLTDVRRFLFSPSRPGELLDEADRRNFPVDRVNG